MFPQQGFVHDPLHKWSVSTQKQRRIETRGGGETGNTGGGNGGGGGELSGLESFNSRNKSASVSGTAVSSCEVESGVCNYYPFLFVTEQSSPTWRDIDRHAEVEKHMERWRDIE
jgi:hypothetical protein